MTMALICSFQQVIPVLPFALKERIGIPEDQVQRWTSILLAIYGASLFLGSRSLTVFLPSPVGHAYMARC